MTEELIGQALAAFAERPERIPLLCIVGPTASGKSRLALALARRLNGEIVSCDSMQVYRRMDIGTAKPSAKERQEIRHHMLDVVEPEVPYSCADYVAGAREAIADVHARGRLAVVCGGTGLYLDRLLHGGTDDRAAASPPVRAEYEAYRVAHGNAALHRLLEEIDPESACAIHENNVPRVIRALEIYRLTGQTKSALDRLCAQPDPTYAPFVVGLSWEREVLNRRIDERIDGMLAEGLLEETEGLLADGVFDVNATAAQAIGYKELLAYLRGEERLEQAVERLRIATHRYAKRQMTWFGAKAYVRWLEAAFMDRA